MSCFLHCIRVTFVWNVRSIIKSPHIHRNTARALHENPLSPCPINFFLFWKILNNSDLLTSLDETSRKKSCKAQRTTCSCVQTADLRSEENLVFCQVGIVTVCVYIWDSVHLSSEVFVLLLPYYCSCACLNRKASPLEPESPRTRSPWHPCAPSQMLRSEVAASLKNLAMRGVFVPVKTKRTLRSELWRGERLCKWGTTIATKHSQWRKVCFSHV